MEHSRIFLKITESTIGQNELFVLYIATSNLFVHLNHNIGLQFILEQSTHVGAYC